MAGCAHPPSLGVELSCRRHHPWWHLLKLKLAPGKAKQPPSLVAELYSSSENGTSACYLYLYGFLLRLSMSSRYSATACQVVTQ